MKSLYESVLRRVNKNEFGLSGRSIHKRVNIENWNYSVNCGDLLGPLICDWLLDKAGIDKDAKRNKTIHLLSVGSVIGTGVNFDATVWGSGIHRLEAVKNVFRQKRKYDVRALRGPVTGAIMKEAGYECKVYADPAILMSLIYRPNERAKKYEYSVIPHFSSVEKYKNANLNVINMRTDDYKGVIDSISASNLIISASLHGIILAETYGVPAVFFNDGMDSELMKYYDWYYSTSRYSVKIANSIEEAINMGPMEMPKTLDIMRDDIVNVFPYDLWNS